MTRRTSILSMLSAIVSAVCPAGRVGVRWTGSVAMPVREITSIDMTDMFEFDTTAAVKSWKELTDKIVQLQRQVITEEKSRSTHGVPVALLKGHS